GAKDAESKSLRTRIFDFHTSIQQRQKKYVTFADSLEQNGKSDMENMLNNLIYLHCQPICRLVHPLIPPCP
ncbi:hypothetical protein, partial [Dolichospermum circinale]|uniref:hypothetical protein n=1 Tax=Dolichospermum circinale TaxID=109265 RepID=UPI001E5DB0EE